MDNNTNLDSKTKKELQKQADEEVSKHSRYALLIGVAILAVLIILDQVLSANIIIILFYIGAFIFGAYASLYLASGINDKISTFTLILIPRLILSILLYLFFNNVMLMVDFAISLLMFEIGRILCKAKGLANKLIPEEPGENKTEEGE